MCEGPSKISGPLESHFANDDFVSKFTDFTINPRVREQGRANFIADKSGTGAALLIYMQGRSITPRTFKMHEKPRDYVGANRVKIRQLMKKVKEREAQNAEKSKTEPVKALWKSDKYNNVTSKLKHMLEDTPVAPRDVSKSFLRAHSASTISRPQSAREPTTHNVSNLELKLDDKFKSKDDIDFVRLNRELVKNSKMKRAPSVEQLARVEEKRHHELETYETKIKGKVPNYLKKRKEDWEQEIVNMIKNKPDPDQPPGHRKLPEEERLKTLELLKETQARLLKEVNSLPIRNDTFHLQSKKNDYEKRFNEIDEAVKIFSRPKVFVKLNE